MSITDKTGELVAFKSVNDDNDLVIINRSGVVIRVHVADIRVMGRATQGVRIINLEKRKKSTMPKLSTTPKTAPKQTPMNN